jgi:hypothetical protein
MQKIYIIKYCGTWYESNCGRLAFMFTNSQHISNDGNFFNDSDDDFIESEKG